MYQKIVLASTIVDASYAMLPMVRWERGGWLLTIGMIPLIISKPLRLWIYSIWK